MTDERGAPRDKEKRQVGMGTSGGGLKGCEGGGGLGGRETLAGRGRERMVNLERGRHRLRGLASTCGHTGEVAAMQPCMSDRSSLAALPLRSGPTCCHARFQVRAVACSHSRALTRD